MIPPSRKFCIIIQHWISVICENQANNICLSTTTQTSKTSLQKYIFTYAMFLESTFGLLVFLLRFTNCLSIKTRGCDIRDFGATGSVKQPDVEIANTNAQAIAEAFRNANSGLCGSASRTVYIPKSLPFYFTSIYVRILAKVIYLKLTIRYAIFSCRI